MNRFRSVLPALLAGAAACLLTAFLTARLCGEAQFAALSALCARLARENPRLTPVLLDALRDLPAPGAAGAFLRNYGYVPGDFAFFPAGLPLLLLAAALGIFWLLRLRDRRLTARLDTLARKLEGLCLGRPVPAPEPEEGPFARLETEMGRTFAALSRTRDQALAARAGYAENLAGIAHQLKTPITALRLLNQTGAPRDQTERQLDRLLHLEESLLLLARVDSGALVLEPRDTDVFTLLCLAEETLEPLLREKGVQIAIPEDLPPAPLTVDPDWTLEAVLNLVRNCLDYSPPGGTIRCFWETTPLCTRITLEDEGPGFSGEDLPRLFQRFYRGSRAAAGGIGLGLPLARELIQKQNGSLRAENRPQGGARFEIRFYHP